MSFYRAGSGGKITTAWGTSVEDALGAITDVGFRPELPCDYVIWKEDSTYYRRNGKDGKIDDNNTNLTTLTHATIDDLPYGGKIVWKGDLTLTEKLVIDQNALVLEGLNYGGQDPNNGLGTRVNGLIGGTGPMIEIQAVGNIQLRNLYLRVQNITDGPAIYYDDDNLGHSVFENLYIRGDNQTFTPIQVDDSSANEFRNIIARLYGAGIGIDFNASTYSNINTVVGGRFWDGGIGLDFDANCAGNIVIRALMDVIHTGGIGINNAGETNNFFNIRFVSMHANSNTYVGAATADKTIISLCQNLNSGLGVSDAGTNSHIRNNQGYITENSGSSSIDNGTTSKVVAHGLSVTPNAEHFSIIGKENPDNDVGTIWVDTIGAANFTVNVENDPGASNWDFGWKVIVI